MKSFKLSGEESKFRYLVVDCRLNAKGFSLFETKETRVDTVDLVLAGDDAFTGQGKAKIVLM
jgi:hypothetical protein